MSALVEAALSYAALGWYVFPCKPADLAPFTDHGFKDASVEPAAIKAWWRKWPKAMIGVATGASKLALLDVDIDKAKGLDGEVAFATLLNGHTLPPDLTVARTPRGGRHIYFAARPDLVVPSTAGKLGRGLDTRGEGGYVIVPPSINSAGLAYTWESWGVFHPAPDWLVVAKPERPRKDWKPAPEASDKRKGAYGTKALADECARIATASEGTRNATLFKSACCVFELVKGNCISESRAWSDLEAAADAAGLDAREVRGTLNSAWEHAEERGPTDGPGLHQANGTQGAGAPGGATTSPGATGATGSTEAPKDGNKRRRRGRLYRGLISSAAFLASMKPPDYLVEGLLLHGSTYTLTGRTGHAKTLIAILAAIRVARGEWFCGRKCKQGTVAFFAGENAENVRVQFFAMCRLLDIDGNALPIQWHDGACSLEEGADRIRATFANTPDLALIIFDSMQAFNESNDENDNLQMLDQTILIRELGNKHPNRPVTIILSHPIKNAARDNLLPRGGSSTLNEVDGNLTAWLEDDNQIVTLDWLGKFRGAPFEPIKLELIIIKPEGLNNASGVQMPCTVIKPAGEARMAEIEAASIDREKTILQTMNENPGMSQNQIATKLAMPRSAVQRSVPKLKERKWVRQVMGKWVLTDTGKQALKIASGEA